MEKRKEDFPRVQIKTKSCTPDSNDDDDDDWQENIMQLQQEK